MKNFGEIIINASGYILSATMTKEILQIIALCTSILGTIIIAVCRIVDWYQRAKKDGKIDEEELKEGMKIVEETGKELENKTKEK